MQKNMDDGREKTRMAMQRLSRKYRRCSADTAFNAYPRVVREPAAL